MWFSQSVRELGGPCHHGFHQITFHFPPCCFPLWEDWQQGESSRARGNGGKCSSAWASPSICNPSTCTRLCRRGSHLPVPQKFLHLSLNCLILSLAVVSTRCMLAVPTCTQGLLYGLAEPITNSQDEITLLFISSLQAHNQLLWQTEYFSLNTCKH